MVEDVVPLSANVDSKLFLMIIVLICDFIISSIVSAVETAITGADFVKIETLAEKGNVKAKKVLLLQEKRQNIISTVLFLNNVVNIMASTIATIICTIYLKIIPIAICTLILTFIILIFCEITPKRIASLNSESVLFIFADFINVILFFSYPFVALLSFLSNNLAKLLKISLKEEVETYSEEELKTLVDISHEQGVIITKEKDIIQNALVFGDKTLQQIMIPIKKVAYIDITASYNEVINKFKNNEYTRYPIIDETIDNVVGILNIKDFVKIQNMGEENFNLKEIMREPFFLNENIKISSAFSRMQKVFTNLVIVRSNNCKTVGICSLEDILEEIVGEIRDEFDEEEYSLDIKQ